MGIDWTDPDHLDPPGPFDEQRAVAKGRTERSEVAWDEDTHSIMDTIDTLRHEVEERRWDDAALTVVGLRHVFAAMKQQDA